MFIKKYYLALAISTLFIACSPSYNIKPNLNIDSKVLKIDDLELKKARLSSDRSTANTNSSITRHSYSLGDNQCQFIGYFYKEMTRKNWFMYKDREDFLKSKAIEKDEIVCNVTQVSNLKFLKCEDKYTLKKRYEISKSTTNEHGYQSISHIYGLKEQCFDKIYSHFEKKAKKDSVKIKEYSFGSYVK